MYIEVMQHPQQELKDKYLLAVKVDDVSVSIALFVPELDPALDPSVAVPMPPTKIIKPENIMDIFNREDIHEYAHLKYNGLFYRFHETSSFSFESVQGTDEVPDFSVIDLASVNDGAIPWRSRLLETSAGKIAHSSRYRELFGQKILGTLFVPFNEGNMGNCKLRLIDRGGIFCNKEIDKTVFEGSDEPNTGKPDWLQEFYSAELKMVESTKDSSKISVKLYWNRDFSHCEHPATFFLESNSGYLPSRKISIDENGEGEFSILHLGLQPGDKVKVKVNALHFSNLGNLEFTIPE